MASYTICIPTRKFFLIYLYIYLYVYLFVCLFSSISDKVEELIDLPQTGNVSKQYFG